MHIYKDLIYCQNSNMSTDPHLQLLMQLKLFILLFYTMVIMVFKLVQYSSAYQRRLIQLTSKFFLKSCTSTLV